MAEEKDNITQLAENLVPVKRTRGKRGRRVYSTEERETALAVYKVTNSLTEAAKSVRAPVSTVKSWVEAAPLGMDEFEQYREQKYKRFVDTAWESIFGALELAKITIATALAEGDTTKFTLRELATYIDLMLNKTMVLSPQEQRQQDYSNKVMHKILASEVDRDAVRGVFRKATTTVEEHILEKPTVPVMAMREIIDDHKFTQIVQEKIKDAKK